MQKLHQDMRILGSLHGYQEALTLYWSLATLGSKPAWILGNWDVQPVQNG